MSVETKKFYYRCKSNPNGPLLVLESYWEAKEMKGHPDYERIDEMGELVPDEEANAENPIPFQGSVGRK